MDRHLPHSTSSASNHLQPAARATVLVVDDTPENIEILGQLLQPQYRVRVANSGERALRLAHTEPRPDLILLDVMMPGTDGYEVMRRLSADPATADIPVIFVTAMDGNDNEEHGLSLGAVDYITKPVVPAIVLARVHTQLELKAARDQLARDNQWLEAEVERRMQENLLIQDLSVRALACLAEARDNETGNHILRTQAYVEMLALALRDKSGYSKALAGNRLAMVVKAAPLHDIGKVGIPDAILLKPGRLSPEEFAVMKSHPRIGADAIAKAMQQSLSAGQVSDAAHNPAAFAFLEIAQEISIGHHEKWDGSGYPERLAGEQIPVSARLMALADVFDALTSRRIYKPPMAIEEASAIIVKGRGSHFDPQVVDAFLACRERFAETARRYTDPSGPA
jgi:putative two-component system response regulator